MTRIQDCLNEGQHPFSRGVKNKKAYIHWQNFKNLFQNHWDSLSHTLQKAPLRRGLTIVQIKNNAILKKKENVVFSTPNQRYDIIICVSWFKLFSLVSDVAHRPIVCLIRRDAPFCYLSWHLRCNEDSTLLGESVQITYHSTVQNPNQLRIKDFYTPKKSL